MVIAGVTRPRQHLSTVGSTRVSLVCLHRFAARAGDVASGIGGVYPLWAAHGHHVQPRERGAPNHAKHKPTDEAKGWSDDSTGHNEQGKQDREDDFSGRLVGSRESIDVVAVGDHALSYTIGMYG